MKLRNHRPLSHCTGFTLVEIMVGLAIGMLATLVIIQVFSVFEAQKRTTTGAGDAQTNGSIALHTIGSDLSQAGYGIMPGGTSLLKCAQLTIDGVPDATTPNRLTPVAITDGASDSLTVRYGDTAFGGITTAVLGNVGNVITVNDNFSCAPTNTAVTIVGTACNMASVSSVAAPSTITLSPPVAGADIASLGTWTDIACLGTWNEITYTVMNATSKDAHLARAGQAFMANIVNLQAQYGISGTASSNLITGWVDATGTWAAPSTLDRNRIKAIRVAIVARNPKMETGNVTNAVNIWQNTTAVNLSADSNWQRYRYRVFETIIPLRNVIWAVSTLP